MDPQRSEAVERVAIIGMAGRFPCASNVSEFWRNLADGRECITFFSEEKVTAEGVDASVVRNPRHVRAGGVLDGADLFDARFFGYSPREAEVLDPQHRVFLECAWEALEDAAYSPNNYRGSIGVFAGSAMSSYMSRFQTPSGAIDFVTRVGNDKDFVPTRVSYKLNLKGPSVNIQTACSTSLVAVHVACESVLTGACDIALAGGVSIIFPQKTGHLYEEEGILSPDGHCRAFDAEARGTVAGNGVGIVVLKRLSEALADRDNIRAVILGSAVNNDGDRKVGYTAPSIDGQAQAIAMAQMMAGVDAGDISYIEAHGTGTQLGDPIEIAALTQAFRMRTTKRGFCAVGSLKTSVGHLDAAAGVAGLIKTVLALENRVLPASLHYERPNPQIDFQSSPFYVNARSASWSPAGKPRIAGVSSFGIGGTNAHVIVREAPPRPEKIPTTQPQLIVLSAKGEESLAASIETFAEHLGSHNDVDLRDVAYTLQVGRKAFPHRQAFVCPTANAADVLMTGQPIAGTVDTTGAPPSVAFLFPGAGAQYFNMAKGLHMAMPAFAEQMDLCCGLLEKPLGVDLRSVLYGDESQAQDSTEMLRHTRLGLPALFVTEYALARLWMSLGVRPAAMIGHSLGEYVAACVSGVLSLEDALKLVVDRARLMETLPSGSMLAVPVSERRIREIFGSDMSIATINAPAMCVVSGRAEQMEKAAAALAAHGIESRRVHVDVAAHSEVVDPILAEFSACAGDLRLRPPDIPYISSVTGRWITPREACDASYWPKHIRETVRFSDGLSELLDDPKRILLEVGPGHTLGGLVRQHPKCRDGHLVLSSVRHVHDSESDHELFLKAVGRLWTAGIDIDWDQLHQPSTPRRISLPPYSFDRQRYWVEPAAVQTQSAGKNGNIDDWFYVPSWRPLMALPHFQDGELANRRRTWLVFDDGSPLSAAVTKRLFDESQHVVTVNMGTSYEGLFKNVCSIRPGQPDDYVGLIAALRRAGSAPDRIVHFWSRSDEDLGFCAWQQRGYLSLLYLAKALEGDSREVQLTIVSSLLASLRGEPSPLPDKATLLGPAMVIAQEYPHIGCRVVDIEPQPAASAPDRIAAELCVEHGEFLVASRPDARYVRSYERVRLAAGGKAVRRLRQNGVYVITGGLGGVGLLLAEYLARTVRARLVLFGRSELPQRTEWNRWLDSHNASDRMSSKIRKLLSIEQAGSEVLVLRADVADESQLRSVFEAAEARFGQVDGVLHAAGVTSGPSVLHPIIEMGALESAEQFRPKIDGLRALDRVLREKPLDFCLLFSSNASVLGGLGFIAYSAANHFMDSFAAARNPNSTFQWISSNWDGWLLDSASATESMRTSMDTYSMIPSESAEAFRRVVEMSTVPQVVVSTGDLDRRLQLWVRKAEIRPGDQPIHHPRPKLRDTYVEPRDETETELARIWSEFIGVNKIGAQDNFFELGGHSLMGTQIMSRVREAFAVDLPLRALFETRTIAALAKVVSDRRAELILNDLEALGEKEVEAELSRRMNATSN